MKKLFANVGAKMAALADDIASYNDPTRNQSLQQAPGRPGPNGTSPGGAGPVDSEPDPVLEHLLRNVRSRHVRQHFARTPAAEYTQQRAVTVQAATFNVGGKKPPPGLRLDDWLGPAPGQPPAAAAAAAGGVRCRWPAAGGALVAGGEGEQARAAGPAGPDVVALSFQEVVPLNAGSVMGVWATDHADAWDRCVGAYLNGEDWASQQYGPAAPPAVGQAAAAAAAAALLDSRWQGGPQQQQAAGAAGDGGEGPGGSYVQVASKQLVGVYLSVWVRRALLPAVRGVQVTTVATGFGGYLGNKGAVAARLRLFDSSLVLLAAHLTAGEAEGDEARRNADVADILRRAAFAGGAPDGGGGGAVAMTGAAAAAVSASLGPGHWPPGPSPITDHDLAIWMGDLNYRLATTSNSSSGNNNGGAAAAGAAASAASVNGGANNGGANGGVTGAAAGPAPGLSDADVRAAIRGGSLEALLAADQLLRERAAGRVFQGWHEGRITFPPTYKFKVGTHTYQGDDGPAPAASGPASASASFAALQSASAADPAVPRPPGPGDDDSAAPAAASAAGDAERQKRRTPAWCDRVLWWERRGSGAHGSGTSGTGGGPGARLEQLGYWRGELTISDHRPVCAAFRCVVRCYDRPRIELLLEAALREVDRMQQSLRPRVTVEPVVLDAGEWVAPGYPHSLRLSLVNEGAVEALFHFVPPPNPTAPGRGAGGGKFGLDDETPPLPPWLLARPAEGVLLPGQTCEMELTVLVEGGPGGGAEALSASAPSSSSSSAPSAPSSLSAGCPLDAIAILRIEDSGDKFVSIGGRYCRSFLGMSLESLGRLGATPALAPSQAAGLAARLGLPPLQLTPASRAAAAAGVPKELAALLAALRSGGEDESSNPGSGCPLHQPGVLVDSAAHVLLRAGDGDGGGDVPAAASGAMGGGGDASEEAAAEALQPTGREAQRALVRHLGWLRLHLDAGGAVPPSAPPHDVAALLLLWLGQLPQPLIPGAAAEAAADAPPATAADAAALLCRHCGGAQLAAVAALLTALRAAVAPEAAARNGLTAGRLAAALGAWCLPPLPAGAGADAGANRRALLTALLGGGAEADGELAGLAEAVAGLAL